MSNAPQTEITVTRGLAELKTLDDRIDKAIRGNSYIGIVKGKKVIPGYNKNEDYEDEVKSKYQSAKDLIARRNLIKSAIVKSNAVTLVTIAGETMTVAEAIERKTSIVYDQKLLLALKQSYSQAIKSYEKESDIVKDRLDTLLNTTFGTDKKPTTEQYESTSKPFLEQNEVRLIDPLGLKGEFDKLETEIDEFLLNVDYSLSESNAITRISV